MQMHYFAICSGKVYSIPIIPYTPTRNEWWVHWIFLLNMPKLRRLAAGEVSLVHIVCTTHTLENCTKSADHNVSYCEIFNHSVLRSSCCRFIYEKGGSKNTTVLKKLCIENGISFVKLGMFHNIRWSVWRNDIGLLLKISRLRVVRWGVFLGVQSEVHWRHWELVNLNWLGVKHQLTTGLSCLYSILHSSSIAGWIACVNGRRYRTPISMYCFILTSLELLFFSPQTRQRRNHPCPPWPWSCLREEVCRTW